MEGSTAGPAAAQGGQAAGGEGGGEQQGGADLSQLAQQMETLTGGQEQLRQFLMSEPWAPQEQPPQSQEPQSPEPLDLSFLDPEDPGFDPEAMAAKLGGLIDQTMAQREQARIAQHVQPLNERLDEQRIKSEAQMLVDEFPEMGDPEIAPQVVAAARQTAEAYGQPNLANEPWFWRMTYMAGRAAQAAQDEGAEPPPAAHLEGGSGARPGASQADIADQIFAGSGQSGRGALPFG